MSHDDLLGVFRGQANLEYAKLYELINIIIYKAKVTKRRRKNIGDKK